MPCIVTKFLLGDKVRVCTTYALEDDEGEWAGEEGKVTQIQFSIYEPTLYEVESSPGASEWFKEEYLEKIDE
jgi:hypothetical protein